MNSGVKGFSTGKLGRSEGPKDDISRIIILVQCCVDLGLAVGC